MSDVQATVEISTRVDIPLSDIITNVAQNFLELYTHPWFVVSIVFTFFLGQFIHVLLRGYLSQWRDVTKAIIIWTSQIVFGYAVAQEFVDLPDVNKFAWITGINAIALYYLLLWVSTKWFKWPHVAQWLTLKKTTLNDDGEVNFGETISFIAKNRKGK